MIESGDEVPRARTRPHRWFAWVWVVPIVAGAIVLWLGARAYVLHGPDITISFKNADGLQERQSTIRHRGVVVGRVEEVELAPDLSRVIVHARMTRSAKRIVRSLICSANSFGTALQSCSGRAVRNPQ